MRTFVQQTFPNVSYVWLLQWYESARNEDRNKQGQPNWHKPTIAPITNYFRRVDRSTVLVIFCQCFNRDLIAFPTVYEIWRTEIKNRRFYPPHPTLALSLDVPSNFGVRVRLHVETFKTLRAAFYWQPQHPRFSIHVCHKLHKRCNFLLKISNLHNHSTLNKNVPLYLLPSPLVDFWKPKWILGSRT